MDEQDLGLYYALFSEIGILSQLSRAAMDARLPDGLQQTHFGVVNHLVRLGDGQTPLEIARAFQVPKTSMTHTLSGLERHGLIEMRPNPDDKRSKRVWMTNKGRLFRDEAVAALAPLFERLAKAVPPDRVALGLPTLQQTRKFMDSNRDR